MLQKYHVEILQQALKGVFSSAALAKMIEANVYQDRVAAQFGHDEYHFDNNAFEKSYAYIEGQRALVISSLQKNDPPSAWSAFGRLTHTAQDFYAHTNYVDLWLARHWNGARPGPSKIDPLDPELIASPALRSGRLYYPLELFSFIKILTPLVLPLLPHDSHAWMNLDSPAQGFKFDYVLSASVKRTVIEYEETTKELQEDLFGMFVNR